LVYGSSVSPESKSIQGVPDREMELAVLDDLSEADPYFFAHSASFVYFKFKSERVGQKNGGGTNYPIDAVPAAFLCDAV
jgi:hypothetical protein